MILYLTISASLKLSKVSISLNILYWSSSDQGTNFLRDSLYSFLFSKSNISDNLVYSPLIIFSEHFLHGVNPIINTSSFNSLLIVKFIISLPHKRVIDRSLKKLLTQHFL